jgi:hypothetical protein
MSTIIASVSNPSFEINSGYNTVPSGWRSISSHPTQIGYALTSIADSGFDAHAGNYWLGTNVNDDGGTQTIEELQWLSVAEVLNGNFTPTSIRCRAFFITDGSSVSFGAVGIRFYDEVSALVQGLTRGNKVWDATWAESSVKMAVPSGAKRFLLELFLQNPAGGSGEELHVGADSVQNVIIYGTSVGESSGNFPIMTIAM